MLKEACTLSKAQLTDWTGDVYYRYASDSSFGTWFTDVIWFFEMMYLASLMWKKGMSFNQDRARMYGIGSTIAIGMAAFWGAWHHYICYDEAQTCFLMTWGCVCVSIMICGSMALLSGVYLLCGNKTSAATKALEVVLLSTFIYIGASNFFEMKPYITIGLCGNVAPQILLFISVSTAMPCFVIYANTTVLCCCCANCLSLSLSLLSPPPPPHFLPLI
jgi:hypothetical protein